MHLHKATIIVFNDVHFAFKYPVTTLAKHMLQKATKEPERHLLATPDAMRPLLDLRSELFSLKR